ncbi:MAG: BlaI/MecI/CopY family transcriptional regulator [Oscillospiraceae bacterium]|nr:BlaI/MecI/CopY family transcriptional regulator [Oscillospiraceae bacterium]
MKKIRKLPESELKIMMTIWDNDPPVARNVLSKQLADQSWSDPTILTMLSRLVKKGYLSCEKQGNKNLYTPLITRDEYMLSESMSFGEKVQNVSITSLMSAFVQSRGITKDEIDELEKMIREFRQSAEE